MRKSVGAAVLVVTLLASSVASAQAAVYEGNFKGLPGSKVELTFAKHNGKRFLESYFLSYPTTCEGGPTSQSTIGPPSERVRVRDGHFRYVVGSPDSTNFFRLVGDLKRDGKAVGVFRSRNYAGTTWGVCDSGRLEWRAFK